MNNKHYMNNNRQAPQRKPITRHNNTIVNFIQKNKISVFIAIASYLGGIFSQVLIEKYKSNLEQRKILVEQRSILWKSASDHFAQYIINWDRLRIAHLERISETHRNNIAECSRELDNITFTKREKDRLDRYLQKRDDAKDLLVADLEAARVLYRNTVVPGEIKKFDDFRNKNKSKNSCELPDVRELRKMQGDILLPMLNEMSKSIEEE